MLCRSAPINPRSAVAPVSTAFEPGWRVRWGEEFCNDVEQRAGPVSPSSRSQASRPPVAAPGRLRSGVSARTTRQRPAAVGSKRSQRPDAESLRLRGAEAGGRRRGTQSSTATVTRDPQGVASDRGLRRGDFGASGSGVEQLPGVEAGDDDVAEASAPARRGLASQTVLSLIRFYQRAISPGIGQVCRYEPTCSHYMHEAIERHGLLKGGWLGLRRLSRCRPYGGRGYDPVSD